MTKYFKKGYTLGHQATIIIHLDALETIAEDPNFGRKLRDAVLIKSNLSPQGPQTVAFNACAATRSEDAGAVIEVHDADKKALVETGGNTGRIIKLAV